MSSTRKLAAILFADIVGYTALMQHDEKAALEKLHFFKEQLNENVTNTGGQIIQYYGDGCLAIFNNPTDAVFCSKTLQEKFRTQFQIPVRMGIHLGEILIEDGNIFGDSVNIAARIQSMSVPGGVLFSDVIKNQIKNKTEFQFTSLGKFEFKNVDEPMEVLALSNEGFPVPNVSELQGKFKDSTKPKPWFKNKIKLSAVVLLMAALAVAGYFINKSFSSPGTGKSIAVLAFTDMSSDKSQEYLGDGLAEDIITALSKIKELKVIGRTSSFQFKGKNTDLREIGEKLDVAAVLEGSVQKSGNTLRVTAQLIDTKDGTHIWSQKWDRDMNEILKVQDEIAFGISEKLKVTYLKKPGKANIKVNPEAYELYLQARQIYYSGRANNIEKAHQLLLKSTAIDSTYSSTHAFLSMTYRNLPFLDKKNRQLLADSVHYHAQKALTLNPEDPIAYIAMANWYTNQMNWVETDKMLRKAVDLNPGATEKDRLAAFLNNIGYREEAFVLNKEAQLLDPISPSTKYYHLALLVRAKKFDEAIKTGKKYLELDSSIISFWGYIGQAHIGKKEYREALNAWVKQHEANDNKDLANIYRTSDFKTAMHAWLDMVKVKKINSGDLGIAITYAMLEDKENTLKHLELAVANNENSLASIKEYWLFDFVRNEPRLKELYRKLNFDAYDEYRKSLK